MARDWEEDLAQVVGDPLAFQIGYRARLAKQQAEQFAQDGQQMLAEYLRYELELLPAPSQVEDFNRQVDALSQRFETLLDKAERLLSAKKGFQNKDNHTT